MLYNEKEEVYIKIRAELLSRGHFILVMSFHFAEIAFCNEMFPYQ